MSTEPMFFIASIKHTSKEHEHITWWATNHRGYTPVLGERCGRYTLEQAKKLNDGYDTLAVPAEALQPLLSREPYYLLSHTHTAHRFYDQRGPVVDNTKANWDAIVESALDGVMLQVKPEIFRRKRRSFALDLAVAAWVTLQS